LFDGTLLGPAEIVEMKRTVMVDKVPMGLGVDRVDVPCPGGQKRAVWGNSGGGPGFNSYSLISGDGSRQLVIAMNVFDIAEDVAGRPAVPEGASLLPAIVGVFC
jgi:D-alanyl-D-alanine carboxypeptidase